MEATTAINIIKLKKDKSMVANLAPNQDKAPSFEKKNKQIIYQVIPKTKITAAPKTNACFNSFRYR